MCWESLRGKCSKQCSQMYLIMQHPQLPHPTLLIHIFQVHASEHCLMKHLEKYWPKTYTEIPAKQTHFFYISYYLEEIAKIPYDRSLVGKTSRPVVLREKTDFHALAILYFTKAATPKCKPAANKMEATMYSSRGISHSKYPMRHGEQRRLGSCENICQNRVSEECFQLPWKA